MLELFTNLFWTTATQAVSLIVPIISIVITMKIIELFILKGW